MGWFLILMVPPGLERSTGVGQRPEQRLVQQLIAQAAVEALDEAVLVWFAGCNVVPPDTSLVGPVQDGVRGQLCAVVTDDRIRASPSSANNVVQLTRHAPAGDRGVGDQGEALSGAVVDHRQDAEAPSVGELVRDEVQAPA